MKSSVVCEQGFEAADYHDRSFASHKPVRLVHLQLLPLFSGVQRVTFEEFQNVDRSEFEPVLICKESGALSKAVEQLGIDTQYAPSLVRPISLFRDFSAGRQLYRLFKRLAPDILHTHSSKTGILGRIAGRLSGVPVVIHSVHGYAFPYASSWLARWVYFTVEYLGGKLGDAFVVLNESDRQMAIKKLHIPEGKVHLIPNGVDADDFAKSVGGQRTEIRREIFKLSDDDVICVGMVGRLWRQKNPACLLRAALKVLKQTDKPVHFYFIGDGELRAELEQVIASHGLQSQIQVLGWRHDVAALLSGLDIFVLPSRWEGMPLAILEAMASSLPVIASDIAGNRDLVSHSVDGILFDTDNDEQLADGILSLVNTAGMRDEMGANARNKVLDHYRIRNRVKRMTDLYQSLLAEKKRQKVSGLQYKS
ncbi:MAG: glycosyltransferase family 4 protein [Pseudomonadales bacterium]